MVGSGLDVADPVADDRRTLPVPVDGNPFMLGGGGAEDGPAVSSETGEEAGEIDLRRREVPEFSRRGRVSLVMMFHSPVQTKSVILSSRGITTGLDSSRSSPEKIQPRLRTAKAVRGRSAPPPRGLESIREENAGQELSSENLGRRQTVEDSTR